jgi:hypothetical protein
MLPRGDPERRTNRLKALLRRQIPGATEESLLARALSSHGVACRSNNGPIGQRGRAVPEAMKNR